ncbi:putative transmembrane protein [Apostichopus japonicus]|uniref:Putative transmembrane protein n=1 Tax=Stichopus japonicus TaxID=307972 RepID=A0A2G8LC21_STIJA|nr:putative transmembrane protein [Apostichopus japonicus]
MAYQNKDGMLVFVTGSTMSESTTDHTMTASGDKNGKKSMEISRKRKFVSLLICLGTVVASVLQLGISFWASRTVLNISAGSFWASLPVLLGIVVASAGIFCGKPGKCAMSAGISFLVVGVLVVVVGAIIDGITATAVSSIDFSQCRHSPRGQANCTHLYPCNVQLLALIPVTAVISHKEQMMSVILDTLVLVARDYMSPVKNTTTPTTPSAPGPSTPPKGTSPTPSHSVRIA